VRNEWRESEREKERDWTMGKVMVDRWEGEMARMWEWELGGASLESTLFVS